MLVSKFSQRIPLIGISFLDVYSLGYGHLFLAPNRHDKTPSYTGGK